MRKITAVNGNLSDLVAVLNTVLQDEGDMDVTVCGAMPIHIYCDDKNHGIILDSEGNLEEEE